MKTFEPEKGLHLCFLSEIHQIDSLKSFLVCASVVQLNVFNQDVTLYQGKEPLEI